jgi:glucose/arabinose dehydrogenase
MQRSILVRALRRGGLGLLACLLLASVCMLVERRAEAKKVMFGTYPPGFVSEIIAGAGLPFPTAIAFAADNRMFIALKGGVVRVMQNGALLPTPFIDLSNEVNNFADHGLLGLAVHPNFPATPYVYLLYTYDPPGVTNPDEVGARVARLLRVSANAGNPNVASANAADRVVILGTNSTLANSGNTTNQEDYTQAACGLGPNYVQDCVPSDYDSHSIGTVMFGPDGRLYVTAGDASSYRAADPRALRAQDLDSLAGKVLRLDPITGAGLSDNPYWNGSPSANRSKVYSYGLRNPFRMTFRPGTNELYVSDVGWGTWEELNIGRARNFGWPCYEGGAVNNGNGNVPQSLQQPEYANNSATRTRCQALYAQGLSAVQAPAYAYGHTLAGGSVVMGTFYTGTSYPAQYRNALFWGDYTNFFIKTATVNGGNQLNVSDFATNVEDLGGPVQFVQGPDTNLYYIALGFPNSEIRRLRYAGAGNNPPVADATANVTTGNAPLTVRFSSANSFDADAQPLTYQWDFGDGTTSNQASPTKVYMVGGRYTVRLTVSDPPGATSSDTLEINVNNTRPTVTINAPGNGARYNVGTVLGFSGTATDAEEGNLSNRIEWKAILHHNEHVHFDFFTFVGASGTYTIPDHGDNTYFDLCATVTDRAGAAAETRCVELRPNTVQYRFESTPSGLSLNYDGSARVTPFTVTTIPNSRHDVSAAETQNGLLFANWSDGGARSHQITIGAANQTLRATYTTPAALAYLSDLTPTFATNAIGPYERDRSNGGAAAGDGKVLNLDAVRYNKGLGVSARSELRYHLAGLYRNFLADIGLDEEVGSLGTVLFRVIVDGQEVYNSGVMTGRTATQRINLNVAGKNELRLVVDPLGASGNRWNKADWANARLTR